MQKASATSIARKFSKFLGKVQHGRTIQVLKHGRAVARLVPDCDFMDGKSAADLFRGHFGDASAAAAIAKELSKLNEEEANALAHWHGRFRRGRARRSLGIMLLFVVGCSGDLAETEKKYNDIIRQAPDQIVFVKEFDRLFPINYKSISGFSARPGNQTLLKGMGPDWGRPMSQG